MRLALFTDTLGDVNGVARFVIDLAAAARARAADLQVCTSTRRAVPLVANVHNLPPRARMPLPGYRTLDLALPARALAHAARSLRPHAIHVSTPGPVGLAGRALALRRGWPLICTHHTDFPGFARVLAPPGLRAVTAALAHAYLRWFYRPAQRVLARSAASTPALHALGVPEHRVHVLTPGIDLATLQSARPDTGVWTRLGVPASPLKVLYAGRLSRDKNLALLMQAWPLVQAHLTAGGREGCLVLAGDGPHRAELERAARGGGVRFLGMQDRASLGVLYASSDVFVTPSRTDTLGQTVMEAQACGLPAIVSAAGGPATLVVDGVSGRVVASTAPEAWARAISTLLLDDGARARAGAAARARGGAWDFERSFADFWAVHEACVHERASASPGPA